MRFIYIKKDEDRVVSIHKTRSLDHANAFDEYIVSDNFDMSKEITNENGEAVKVDYMLTATEFLERYNQDYRQQRLSAYPPIEDQLDMMYHKGFDAWKTQIDEIKAKYPKPQE